VVDRAFGLERTVEERAAAPFAGGIARNGYQCGMVWGSALAAGAEAHRRFGAGARAEAVGIEAARRVVKSFRAQNGAVDCFDLTGVDFESKTQTWRYLLTGKAVGCFRMAARYAPVAKAAPTIARFLAATNGRFECAEIVGRKFESVADHAAFVRDGGCSRVVDGLAAG
jgi:hypothetical protein